MFKILKNISFAIFTLMLLSAFTANVHAVDFSIEKVEVDDIVAGSNPISVERESTIDVEVQLKGTGRSDNVRVKAWIGGYEFGSIREESEIFDIEPDVVYKKTISLEIPEDIDANDDYTLHVEVFDDDNSFEQKFLLRVDEIRHRVNVLDVLLRPGNNVKAGEPLFITARLENLGAKKEDDIKVIASIPELGISTATFIDELTNDEEDNEDEESSMSSDELFLRIPENAKTGIYNLKVDVEYNRGRSVLTDTLQVAVTGVSAAEKEAVVDVDALTKSLEVGGSTTYVVTVQNFGESKTFKVEIEGEQLFADSSISPKTFTLADQESKDVKVTLTPKSDAESGLKDFTVKVWSEDKLVEELSLQANVVEKAQDNADTRDVWVIGFIVLVIILIVLGLIMAFQRMRKPEEPGDEGTSYY